MFYFGSGEQEARPDEAWFGAVDFISSKNNFIALADVLGVPVPRTLCFATAIAVCGQYILSFPHPCYLKTAVSGVGICWCADANELRTALLKFEPGELGTDPGWQAAVPDRWTATDSGASCPGTAAASLIASWRGTPVTGVPRACPTYDCSSVLKEHGRVEMDAGIMDGRNLSASAVAAISNTANPIQLARGSWTAAST